MILVLGGTSESRDIVQELIQKNIPLVYAATTRIIDIQSDLVTQITARLTVVTLEDLVHSQNIQCIVDATHPFATEITTLAIDMAKSKSVQYIRFEREILENVNSNDYITKADSIEKAASICQNNGGNILSVVGTRLLPLLCSNILDFKNNLFVRVLPVSSSLATCEELGIHPSHIIAMQGPFDSDFNLYLLNKLAINTMLTKESGDRGGLSAKIDACKAAKCKLVILNRPKMDYPQKLTSLEECVHAATQHITR